MDSVASEDGDDIVQLVSLSDIALYITHIGYCAPENGLMFCPLLHFTSYSWQILFLIKVIAKMTRSRKYIL